MVGGGVDPRAGSGASAAAWQELSGPTRRRGWRLAVRSQRVVPRRIGRVPRRRCRLPPEAPSEAAVVGGGSDPRAGMGVGRHAARVGLRPLVRAYTCPNSEMGTIREHIRV